MPCTMLGVVLLFLQLHCLALVRTSLDLSFWCLAALACHPKQVVMPNPQRPPNGLVLGSYPHEESIIGERKAQGYQVSEHLTFSFGCLLDIFFEWSETPRFKTPNTIELFWNINGLHRGSLKDIDPYEEAFDCMLLLLTPRTSKLDGFALLLTKKKRTLKIRKTKTLVY
ncbi:hypothetical protein BS17DRAFT_764059 [Gyrodon lividus]|nr:hypothetical protein BS17DRAFT_764059 [Gyrodon lividus]